MTGDTRKLIVSPSGVQFDLRYLADKDGIVIRGGRPWPDAVGVNPLHIDVAMKETARLEQGGGIGTGNLWDNAVMSFGGPHWIAYLPADASQGRLWYVLGELLPMASSEVAARVTKLLDEAPMGWVINRGTLTLKGSSVPVSGKALRDWIRGPEGKTPPSGPAYERCEAFAVAVAELFCDDKALPRQRELFAEYLLSGNLESKVYDGIGDPRRLHATELAELHYVMVAFHAMSVNRPGWTASALKAAGAATWHPGTPLRSRAIAIRDALVAGMREPKQEQWRKVRWPNFRMSAKARWGSVITDQWCPVP